jgi:YVTN family beta-propeller protein
VNSNTVTAILARHHGIGRHELEFSIEAKITVGTRPAGVAVTPDGEKVYVANQESGSVSTISTATNTVTATVPVPGFPFGVTAGNTMVFVTSSGHTNTGSEPQAATVSKISTVTNRLVDTIPLGDPSEGGRVFPFGVALTPDGSKVFVANENSDTMSVIDTTTDTVTATIPVGQRSCRLRHVHPVAATVSEICRDAWVFKLRGRWTGSSAVAMVRQQP